MLTSSNPTAAEMVAASREMGGAFVQMTSRGRDDKALWTVVAVWGEDAQAVLDAIHPLTADADPQPGDCSVEITLGGPDEDEE